MNSSLDEPRASWWKRPQAKWLLGIPLGGFAMFALGIIFWGAFNTTMAVTNTTAFCANTCHEMRQLVVPEWQQSIHYKNRSGVQAGCPDCHVPKPWVDKMIRKMQASLELYSKAIGKISTREKFEAHRLSMARSVWAQMKKTDSRECRNCHNFDYMDSSLQKKFQHDFLVNTDRTCIDCHKGIAHKLPSGLFPDEIPIAPPEEIEIGRTPLPIHGELTDTIMD